jgi:hypothetical protein
MLTAADDGCANAVKKRKALAATLPEREIQCACGDTTPPLGAVFPSPRKLAQRRSDCSELLHSVRFPSRSSATAHVLTGFTRQSLSFRLVQEHLTCQTGSSLC